MEKPLVSVVLCTYNGAKFIAEQVDSILAQTYRPLELIISDDASADDTQQLLKQYESNSAVRIYYQEKNIGITRNFAFAASQSKGKLIAFSDQDDIWTGNKIERLVNATGNTPLVYSNSLLVDEEGKSLHKKLSDLKKMYSGDDSRGYILYSCVWGHGMLITRELLEQSLPMPDNVHHDIWLTYQAFLNGGIQYVDEVLTFYRQHTASLTRTLPPKRIISTRQKRYKIFKDKLAWIKLMEQHERPEYKPFYQQLVKLFAQREKKRYVPALVRFMFKYRKYFFLLSTKGLADHTIEILKYGLGERPVKNVS